MNVQRKRYATDLAESFNLEEATSVVQMNFNDAPAVNIHGVNISLGVVPAADDEIMRGRWYVTLIPPTINEESSVRNAWFDQFDTGLQATQSLDGSSMVWGSGSFTATSGGPYNVTFSPKSSRNASQNSRMDVLVAIDSVTGLLDEWEATATISLFTTS